MSAASDDLEGRAHRAAEAHLQACNEALYAEDTDDPEDFPETPATAPFCGCDTCVVREILAAAWPHLLELARNEAQQ